MRLIKARVQNYRSIIDTGYFDVESNKTILVGPNEAGKTAVLQALQKLNPPKGTPLFNELRDYPRSKYNDLSKGKIDPASVCVVEGHFQIEPNDLEDLSEEYYGSTFVFSRNLDNSESGYIKDGPPLLTYGELVKDLKRLAAHVDSRAKNSQEPDTSILLPSATLNGITEGFQEHTSISVEKATSLLIWLEGIYTNIDENNKTEEERYDQLKKSLVHPAKQDAVYNRCKKLLPVFVYFNNYFRVKPLIHLEHLAYRIDTNVLDDAQYDYGNICLLKLLGFTARELSNLGNSTPPAQGNQTDLQRFRDQLDKRWYQLNAASVKLTEEIRKVWFPNPDRSEADRLKVIADGQYLKVVVEDDLGVEIELDQRSEGFQWLVSFFIIFFAEAEDAHENAILLLDEPGMSLHGLKQADFRSTISRLGESNQTIYTTHSPFLVGPNELDLVRVVEMADRKLGTKVHTTITASDPAAMLPLQEALGYDLAQSLFTQQRNLILEGLTDYWYIEAISEMFKSNNQLSLNDKISLLPAGTASKIVYFATILHAQKLKVAVLLDSDPAGDQAAKQDTLVHILGNKAIFQTKDVYSGPVVKSEVEDLLRDTLIKVGKSELGWDIAIEAEQQSSRPIVDIFSSKISEFSKYKLAKAFLRWTRSNGPEELSEIERTQWSTLIDRINRTLK